MAQNGDSKIRRGLVLEGGGAKGAWQFGALRALADARIEFDCVAGTSIGALNGALWAARRFDLGEELWRSLKSSRVFTFRLIVLPLFFIGLFTRIFHAYVRGYFPPEAPFSLRIILNGFMSLPLFIEVAPVIVVSILMAMRSRHIPIISIGFLLISLGLLGLLHTMIRGGRSTRRHFFFASSFIMLTALFVYPWVVGVREVLNEFPNLLTLALFIGNVPAVMYGIAIVLRTLNISIFSVGPLEGIIKDLLESEFKVPLFTTVGREIPKYHDPDDLQYSSGSGPDEYSNGLGPDGGKATPLTHSIIKPEYLRVDTLSKSRALNALLATSALPLGLTPWRKHYEGGRLVDGGVVDNIPWYPLIEKMPCDELVIVACNPMSSWDDSASKLKWHRTERLERVLKPGNESYIRPNDDNAVLIVMCDPPELTPLKVQFRKPRHWPQRVIIIAPDRPLGTFLTGTLNFSAKVAVERMAAGYQKAFSIIGEERNLL